MDDKQFLDVLGDIVNETRNGVLEYANPQPGSYEQMPRHEKDEMVARGLKILEVVASHYDLASVEQMLAILEMNRGKR